jgi:hypothetical protein
MSLSDIPLIHQIRDWGPDDPTFDTLLLVGPLVVLIFVLLGRTPITVGIAVFYLLSFISYVLYKSVR